MTYRLIATFFAFSLVMFGTESLGGDWEGTLTVQNLAFHLLLHVNRDGGRGFKATLDSIDQGAQGLAVDSISLDKRNVEFQITRIKVKYDGVMDAKSSAIIGTWSKAGVGVPLVFKRTSKK